MSACNQILGKTFGPKTMAPTEMKNFRFSRKIKIWKKWKPYPKLNFEIKLLAK